MEVELVLQGALMERALAPPVFRGFKQVVIDLVAQGADINKATLEVDGPLLLVGVTPLLLAAFIGRADMVQQLLTLGANPSIWTKDSQMDALTVATLTDDVELARILLAGGAAVTQRQRWAICNMIRNPNEACVPRPISAIHYAAIHGHNDIIELLLEYGEDINAFAGAESDTPLHAACMYNKLHTVRYLVEKGADLHKRTGDRSLPIDIADAFDHQDIVTYLLTHNSPMPQKMGERLSHPHPVDSQPMRQYNVDRASCEQVTICDKCLFTRDMREATMNQQCVWTLANGCKAASDVGPDAPTIADIAHCPVYPQKYSQTGNCEDLQACEDCVVSHHNDSSSPIYSACVWAQHKMACYPLKYAVQLAYDYMEAGCKKHWRSNPGQLKQAPPTLRVESDDGIGFAQTQRDEL
eukprot:g3251.t1